MRSVRAERELSVAPEAALALWADLTRWPEFVEGFARLTEVDAGWPAEGAAIAWESGPDGRGRVSERVVEHTGRRFATEVSEAPLEGEPPRLHGRQTLEVSAERNRSLAELRLDYELVRAGIGSPGPLTDLLFVRRALRDALRRTLERFAAQTEHEVAR